MALLDDAAQTARSVTYLAALPALSTFLAFDKVLRTATAGPGGGMKFPLPPALPDLWTVVSVPSNGVQFNSGVPLILVPVFLVVNAALAAGYLGSIDAAIDGRTPRFVESAATYALPVLVTQVVTFLLTLVGFSFALIGGVILLPVAVLFALAVSYLTWSAPYLVVSRNRGGLDAIRASVKHGLQVEQYARFSLVFLVVGAIASLVLTSLVRGNLVMLVVVALVVAYPLLVVSVATMNVVRALPHVEV